MRRLLAYMTLCLSLLHAEAQEIPLLEEFSFSEDVRITYDPDRKSRYNDYALVPGSYTVFEFTSNNAGDPGNHSAPKTNIAFQVDGAAEEFTLEGEALRKEGDGVYIQYCRCPDKGIQALTSGTISGQKLEDGTWKVTLDVVVKGRRTGKNYTFERTEIYMARQK